ncbi:MAG: HEPN domain-containing protein [bacterium]|nr:HEPN domain-containing protein [bacterium]
MVSFYEGRRGSGSYPLRYRLKRAHEALQDARLLADAGRWNSCVNRLYYACFYAVSALLLQRGLLSTKHSGVRSFFNLHLVKTGEVSAELGQLYNDLFRDRQESDYTDFVEFTEIQVRPRISATEDFVNQISALTVGEPAEDTGNHGQPPDS